MSDAALPEELVRFIVAHIHSVEQLEVLLLLHSEERPWSAHQVSDELRTSVDSAQARLEDLRSSGLVHADGSSENPDYRFSPASTELDRVVQGLEHAYQQRRFTIINLIFSRPSENIRVFARAFRFRKDDDHG